MKLPKDTEVMISERGEERTKDDQIFNALKKRLSDSQVRFEATELVRYNGVIYAR